MFAECKKPMVYFNCSNAEPGATGIECQDSCQIQDKDCVSEWSLVETNFN